MVALHFAAASILETEVAPDACQRAISGKEYPLEHSLHLGQIIQSMFEQGDVGRSMFESLEDHANLNFRFEKREGTPLTLGDLHWHHHISDLGTIVATIVAQDPKDELNAGTIDAGKRLIEAIRGFEKLLSLEVRIGNAQGPQPAIDGAGFPAWLDSWSASSNGIISATVEKLQAAVVAYNESALKSLGTALEFMTPDLNVEAMPARR